MAGNADNIIIGAAVVKISGSDIGYTMGGQAMRYKPEFVSVVADQANGVVRKGRSEERMHVNFTLLEVSLTQLKIAMMQPAENFEDYAGDYDQLTIGSNDACWVDEVEIVFIGKGPGCCVRTFTFPKCIIDDTEKVYEQKRDQAVQFAMSFEVLKDSNGHFCTIADTAS